MHVGWVAVFDAPEGGEPPRFAELFDQVAGRLERALDEPLAAAPGA